MHRRKALALLAGGALAGVTHLAAQPPTAEIRISARKFAYHPERVTIRLGQPVTLVLTSEDRIHGFKLPDFGLRTDMLPGQETRATLTPEKAGSFTFFCDVFCGDGHDEMDGTLVVEA